MGTKITKIVGGFTQNENKGRLIPNSNHETKQTRIRTWCMQNKNSTKFYCKNKIEQGYNKKTYPRPMLNKLKVVINSTSIYNHWAPSSKNFFEKLPIYMSPMCTHVWTVSELKFNWEWTKTQLKVNFKLN